MKPKRVILEASDKEVEVLGRKIVFWRWVGRDNVYVFFIENSAYAIDFNKPLTLHNLERLSGPFSLRNLERLGKDYIFVVQGRKEA